METFLDYCLMSPHFYDHPGADSDNGDLFNAATRPLPNDWRRALADSWVYLTPVGVSLPKQGWKVHVSATVDDAEQVVDIVWDYCMANRMWFKFLKTRRMHLITNGKYASRSSSGKLLTIYTSDEDELVRTLEDLSKSLKDRRGPYVLSDLRWRDGPLYLRYGGFEQTFSESPDGVPVPAIARPDGVLVPDQRKPGFHVPEWVKIPDFVAAEMADQEATAKAGTMPYQIEKVLHFSNGGGIYLARDRDTDQRVVLREARPYAGLDGSGTDAVARLYQEAATLERLSGLDFVPRLLGTFVAWEHHYLVEEYFEGVTLWNLIAGRNPFAHAASEPAAIAAYTTEALDIIDQLELALRQIHERGVVFADLQPRNVLVRPDGRVALVDFEISHRIDIDPSPTLGCAGFIAPHAVGVDRDHYALNSLRLAMFLPVTTLLDLDPSKVDDLADVVEELFDVPPALAERIRSGLARPNSTRTPPLKALFAEAADNPTGQPMADLKAVLARAILASASPERSDRLFPGDPAGLTDGGYNLAHGAAGVLYALHTAGYAAEDAHVDWLGRAAEYARPLHAGLFNGLHGAAYVLHLLGRHDQALTLVDRLTDATAALRSPDLHQGLAGVGLVLRYFANATDDTATQDQLDEVTDRLVRIEPGQDTATRRPAGLMQGGSGTAAFFLHRYEDTGDPLFLDLAGQWLEVDLRRCHADGQGVVVVQDGQRVLVYLDQGSSGIAHPLSHYLAHRPDEHLETLRDGMLSAATAPFTIQPGLFGGRAGLMTVLSRHTSHPGASTALASHVRRLAWHAIGYAGGIAFPGNFLLRLSMDLTTGTAGILAALQDIEKPGSAGIPLVFSDS